MDARKAREIGGIKGENRPNVVYAHRRGQACVVHLRAANRMSDKQRAPFSINGRTIDEKSKLSFNQPCPAVRFED